MPASNHAKQTRKKHGIYVTGSRYSINNPVIERLTNKWYAMTPVQRYDIMQKSGATKRKSGNSMFHTSLKYMEANGF
jgi:hypothetical protein